MLRWFKSLFTRHPSCFWCDLPLPDCTCPVANKEISKIPSNDNHEHRFHGLLVR